MKMSPLTWVVIVTAIIGVSISFIFTRAIASGGTIPAVMFLGFLGFTFYIVFKYVIRPVLNAVRLRKEGVPGRARILAVKKTGMVINNEPVLNLEVEIIDAFGQRYTTSIKTLTSGATKTVYQPGMEVAIKIDPLKKENAVLDDEKAAPRSSINPTPAIEKEWEQTKEETTAILLRGRPARAIIKRYNWLGTYASGNDPVVELELEVMPELYPPYPGKTRAVVPEASVHLFQPGCEVKVKYDLYDMNKIVIDPN